MAVLLADASGVLPEQLSAAMQPMSLVSILSSLPNAIVDLTQSHGRARSKIIFSIECSCCKMNMTFDLPLDYKNSEIADIISAYQSIHKFWCDVYVKRLTDGL